MATPSWRCPASRSRSAPRPASTCAYAGTHFAIATSVMVDALHRVGPEVILWSPARAWFCAAIARYARLLLLDLAGVSFCDARGLSA